MAEVTPESAGGMLRQACRSAGLDASGVELLRLASNAVFRLVSAPVVAWEGDSLPELERAMRVARWLTAEGFPRCGGGRSGTAPWS